MDTVTYFDQVGTDENHLITRGYPKLHLNLIGLLRKDIERDSDLFYTQQASEPDDRQREEVRKALSENLLLHGISSPRP